MRFQIPLTIRKSPLPPFCKGRIKSKPLTKRVATPAEEDTAQVFVGGIFISSTMSQ